MSVSVQIVVVYDILSIKFMKNLHLYRRSTKKKQ